MEKLQFERLYARVKIVSENGGEPEYLYNRESLEPIGLKKNSFDGSEFLEIGNTVNYNNSEYIIKNISFKLETELWDMSGDY